MLKDSLEATDADREPVRQALSETIEDMIVITHGTDAMTNTANLLSDIPDKTIVLTGALSPALFKNPTRCSISARRLQQFRLYPLVFTSL